MEILEKVAYMKGLAEGIGLDVKSKEGKLISVMIGILEEVGLSIEDLEENTVTLGEEIDALSDDLSDVEQLVFEDEALEWIAQEALKRDTGARALRAVLEEFMLDIMYEIPKDPNIGSVIITRPYLEKTGGPLIQMRG